jgi:polyhydroxybutyrate depolymerase
MRHRDRFVLVAVCSMCAALGSLSAAAQRNAAEDPRFSIDVNGATREFLLHTPANLPPNKPVPLVLVFHGGGGQARNMARFTHFDAVADRESFFVAYPESLNRQWNDTRGLSPADDVAFIRALIAHLARTHPVNARRIYATGISNGGFFSIRLACDLTDKIAAIASVAATMPTTLLPVCKPSRPISVLYLEGDEDPLVPIEGGRIGAKLRKNRGENISLAAAAKFWREFDGTVPSAKAEEFPDRAHDGTHVRRETWSGGKQQTEVVVYTIAGGGHTWPGGIQYLPKILVGKVSRQIDGTQVIWDFFRTKSIP